MTGQWRDVGDVMLCRKPRTGENGIVCVNACLGVFGSDVHFNENREKNAFLGQLLFSNCVDFHCQLLLLTK